MIFGRPSPLPQIFLPIGKFPAYWKMAKAAPEDGPLSESVPPFSIPSNPFPSTSPSCSGLQTLAELIGAWFGERKQ